MQDSNGMHFKRVTEDDPEHAELNATLSEHDKYSTNLPSKA